jgi:Magnesium chelatase, subunit ChlI
MPADVSRAPHGGRCLDARPACTRHVLAVLRQPLEDRLTRIEFRGHAECEYFRSMSSKGDERKRCDSTVAARHERSGIPPLRLFSGPHCTAHQRAGIRTRISRPGSGVDQTAWSPCTGISAPPRNGVVDPAGPRPPPAPGLPPRPCAGLGMTRLSGSCSIYGCVSSPR